MPRRSVLLLILTLCAVALGFAIVTLVVTKNRGFIETQSAPSIGGPFTLVDMTGRAVTDQTYRGKWLLIYFGYTSCPDACPTALTDVGVALKDLGSLVDKLQPLFITIDPGRDTVKVIADYLGSFDPRIVGLTGTQAQIDAVSKAYRVYVARESTGGSNYVVDHGSYFYIMDPDGRFMNVVAGDVSGDEMAKRLREAMGS